MVPSFQSSTPETRLTRCTVCEQPYPETTNCIRNWGNSGKAVVETLDYINSSTTRKLCRISVEQSGESAEESCKTMCAKCTTKLEPEQLKKLQKLGRKIKRHDLWCNKYKYKCKSKCCYFLSSLSLYKGELFYILFYFICLRLVLQVLQVFTCCGWYAPAGWVYSSLKRLCG